MTSRERLLRCIKGEPVDRVPISAYELVGWNPDAWENNDPSYSRLMELIREKTDCVYMMNPEERAVGIAPKDIQNRRDCAAVYTRTIYSGPKGDLTMLKRTDDNLHTVWTLEHLLKEPEDIDTYLALPYEAPVYEMEDFYRRQAELGDRGVMMISVGDPICQGAELFEMGAFLTYALTEPARIRYFMDAIYERQSESLRRLLKHDVKDVIFRICGPEYATPPYMNPERFYDLVTRYLIEICRDIKDAGGLPRIHCHGKIGRVLDQFAMTEGVALDPVEPPPDGDITLAEIKKKYKQFCLFGNIENKELEISDKERIDALVKQAMEEGKEGGGFVLMPTAAPISTPLSKRSEENFIQMIESAHEYGRY